MLNEGDCTDKGQPGTEAWGERVSWGLNSKRLSGLRWEERGPYKATHTNHEQVDEK